jgi:hypothetical protein
MSEVSHKTVGGYVVEGSFSLESKSHTSTQKECYPLEIGKRIEVFSRTECNILSVDELELSCTTRTQL